MKIEVTCCRDCPFQYDYMDCKVAHRDLVGEGLTRRPEWCPLPVTVEVKE